MEERQFEVKGHGRAWQRKNSLWSIYEIGDRYGCGLSRERIAQITGAFIMDVGHKLDVYDARKTGRHIVCEFPSKVKAQRFMEEWMFPTTIANRMIGKV